MTGFGFGHQISISAHLGRSVCALGELENMGDDF
jgi:hypothetical protein